MLTNIGEYKKLSLFYGQVWMFAGCGDVSRDANNPQNNSKNPAFKSAECRIEAYCVRSDNTLFPADIAASKLHLGGKEHLCFFVRDSTRRKEYEQILQKTQAHLVRAERLEMAGSIAGRIAHDFNNLLTPLMAYPELIKKKLPEDSQAREDLETIEKTAKQIADINQQLLVLSRRGHYEQEVLNINLVVKDVVSLIRRGTHPEGIEIELNLSDDLFNTRGASEQLLRVIQNLCQNAVDAMGETGTLIIKTENVQLDASLKHYEAVPPGEYIKIMISDTGCGIPAEIMNRIFEPFFTTTKTNHQRGSGLGLSVVHGVIKDHNGYIDLDSEVGRGTAFTLYLPSCHESMKEDTSKIEQPGGAETILIVDDDPMQVKVISRIVRELGYTPLKAQSGEEAVSIVEQVKASENLPDLAVLDMIMGDGIDGAETYERLKEINPRQRAIFLSGYAESAKVAQAQTHGTGVFLKKPIPIKALGKAIREELDRA